MSINLCDLPATELIELYRAKRASPVDATRACLARIDALNPKLNAFCLVDAEGALGSARESEARWAAGAPLGSLDGVPVSIKDLLLTKGWPTLRGSRTVARDQPWNEDAPAVARVREQGAVILGKTTTPEFGWKPVTDSPLTGITRNPWNPDKTPGGSSGGAAAAVATGMCALAIGTDGGGSIRIPASFTGIFGFKPSFGRVPAWPLSQFGTVAHVGPMTRTVTDAALMMNAISRADARDWFALPYDDRDYREALDDGVAGIRMAFAPTLCGAKVDAGVAQLVRDAVDALASLGANIEETTPELGDVREIFRAHWQTGATRVVRSMPAARRGDADPGLVRIAEQAERISLAEYLSAVEARGAMGSTLRRFHAEYPVLLTPMLPIVAFDAGNLMPLEYADAGDDWSVWTPFSYPFNLSQQPAASIPCGFTRDGLPVGLQIVGPMHDDALVLRVARAFEKARPWWDRYARIGG
ncbi:MAG TPA: amidase [Casimicrobiaceae bacterium]|nr:amidase [Casimicrobiaceae bacterium]